MNKRNIVIITTIIVLLAVAAGGFWQYQKSHNRKSSPSGPVLADKQRNLPQGQQKIYEDKIQKAENYLRSLNPKQENYRQEQSNTYIYLGQQYSGLGKLQKAKEAYEFAIKAVPGNEQARLGLSMALAEAGYLAEARAQLEQALQNNPGNYDIWLRYIDLQAASGASVQALNDFYGQALDKTERYIDVITKDAQFQEKTGNIEQAISLWQEAEKAYPSMAAIYEQEVQRLKLIAK